MIESLKMPRKTKQEKFREWEEMRLAQFEQDKVAYFPSLMQALEKSAEENFALSVKNSKFVVYDRNDPRDEYTLSSEYSEKDFQVLLDFEAAVYSRQVARQEADRKWMLRTQALSKLTKEEREVLDL